jgi:hypothetical protein
MITSDKTDILDHRVFDGLAVDDPAHYAAKFMQPNFYLVKMGEKNPSYVIFEVQGNRFVFHLVNFTKCKTYRMTEDFMRGFVLPFCRFRGLKHIQASVERKGMARKLEKLGFKRAYSNIYKSEVAHVL